MRSNTENMEQFIRDHECLHMPIMLDIGKDTSNVMLVILISQNLWPKPLIYLFLKQKILQDVSLFMDVVWIWDWH